MAFAGRFDDLVALAVDDVDVVASTAGEGVDAGSAIKDVVAGVTGDDVIECVTGAVQVIAAQQRQVLQVAAKRPGNCRLHSIDSAVRRVGFDNHVLCIVNPVGVIAVTADQGVGPRKTVKDVITGITGKRVIEGVAGKVQIGVTQQHAVFDVGRQGVADRGADYIAAFAGQFGHDVALAIDDVGVVTCTTDQGVGSCSTIKRVVAGTAIENVVAGVTGDDVVERVTSAVEVVAATQNQVLQVGAQGPVQRSIDRVDFAERGAGFNDDIACVVDEVSVIASAADQGVGARVAVENVVAGVTGQHVIEGVTGKVEVGGAQQNAVLDVGGQGVADGGADHVVAFTGQLGHGVALAVDVVGIIASAADQGVVAGTAVENIVASVACQNVVAGVTGQYVVEGVAGEVEVGGAQQSAVLDVGGQGIADGGADHVMAFTSQFGNGVALAIDDVSIVAGTTYQCVVTGTTIQCVRAGATG